MSKVPSLSLAKVIFLPSGDQCGLTSAAALFVRAVRPLPSVLMTYTSSSRAAFPISNAFWTFPSLIASFGVRDNSVKGYLRPIWRPDRFAGDIGAVGELA